MRRFHANHVSAFPPFPSRFFPHNLRWWGLREAHGQKVVFSLPFSTISPPFPGDGRSQAAPVPFHFFVFFYVRNGVAASENLSSKRSSYSASLYPPSPIGSGDDILDQPDDVHSNTPFLLLFGRNRSCSSENGQDRLFPFLLWTLEREFSRL